MADYVLMGYGTGAIMAVPAEDERDWAFATLHGLPDRAHGPAARRTGRRRAAVPTRVRASRSTVASSNGLDIATAKARAIDWLEEQGIGERKVNYRLRDWLVSRQRFWGCPIPAVYCDDHGVVPVPEDQLPVLAPDDVEFLPTGQSPLALHEGFLHTTCPICGGPARRETDTMDTFVDSSLVLPALLRPLEHRAARSTRRPPATSCRSTSTSGASSTPSSTCSTPASSPGP